MRDSIRKGPRILARAGHRPINQVHPYWQAESDEIQAIRARHDARVNGTAPIDRDGHHVPLAAKYETDFGPIQSLLDGVVQVLVACKAMKEGAHGAGNLGRETRLQLSMLFIEAQKALPILLELEGRDEE